MKEALANLKAMVESGEGIRFEREVAAIENRQQQEGLRLTAQEKSGTPSGTKPVIGRGKENYPQLSGNLIPSTLFMKLMT